MHANDLLMALHAKEWSDEEDRIILEEVGASGRMADCMRMTC